MNIKRTVNFKLEQRKKKGVAVTENVPIRMRLTFDGDQEGAGKSAYPQRRQARTPEGY